MNKHIGNEPIIFLWDNFGPLHADRCEAVARAMPTRRIVGLEIVNKSADYDWDSASGLAFEKITLSKLGAPGAWSPWRIVSAILKQRPKAVFFCHYQKWQILLSATIVRMFGIRAFTMNDSKFDDYPRALWREILKSVFFKPYEGAIVGSRRSADYLRFLGVPGDRIVGGYDSVATDRVRALASAPPAPEGAAFADRHFTVVARLLPKKNLALALRALSILAHAGKARRLVICGSGPLEIELKKLAKDLGISSLVKFEGFLQTADICRTLATTVALILPSTEEQFGQVIPEALSMGVPVLVSENCGARDHLVQTGVNGFVFEPTNAEGLAALMGMIGSNEPMWRTMASSALAASARGDVEHFVKGVGQLLYSAPLHSSESESQTPSAPPEIAPSNDLIRDFA